jgi:hypothetical protein
MQPPDAQQPESAQSQTVWFHAARVIAFCSVFAITVPWYITIFHEPGMEKSDLLIPLYFAPLWGPYLWIVSRLNSAADSRGKKKALALAVSWGALGSLLFSEVFLLMISSVGFSNYEWETEVVFGGLAVLQLSLIGASLKAYLSMKSEPGDGRILLWRLGIASCIVLVFFLATPFFHLEKPVSNEASAFSALRNINTAQSVYAKEHPDRGFAPSLRDLGPSPGAELIDEVLASGLKSRYTITMVGAPPDSGGRIRRYTLIARPQHFGKDETRSFFTDESGVIHATPENRAPTIQDPVL